MPDVIDRLVTAMNAHDPMPRLVSSRTTAVSEGQSDQWPYQQGPPPSNPGQHQAGYGDRVREIASSQIASGESRLT
jgi:hypothetical protein